ncbi:sigma-70 family RNA polymerase sigma factor [Brevibacillus choshinensis]|uniref:sigma-70 family RNA polymerase sigma factor n=1 Tax=Brevibacillus choshinensis TaxID=54911 RepID=UPI002E21FFF2|nr:sigma-70 family RNA polymerase sigma factor [Brevibacillus choshinensis]MED4754165.1 sigma-70 family RNA polymerase sigma factor [Brevibacillus choshinensis]
MEKLQPTDDAAFEQIMREYGTRVLRLVTFLVKDRNVAEDLTQDVFVKVYRHLPRFRKESSIHTWIYRIAVNECKGHLRSWAFRKILPSSWIKRDSDVSTEQIVMHQSERDELVMQVQNLPSMYRQVIVLHYYADLSIAEVANVLSVSEGTVRTRLHRARQHLKKQLGEEGDWEWTRTSGSNN